VVKIKGMTIRSQENKRVRDFSISTYHSLLDELEGAGYCFQTFRSYLKQPAERTIILRHDVDDRKQHSLEFARIQARRGITGVYYFRIVPQSFDPAVIREIYEMGHEIGYHYEDMDLANGEPRRAMELFEQHLAKLRALAPVSTICMHGSPRSKYDNKDLWKHYDYRDHDLVGEPYFDLDFRRVFYLTDTGRRWDGHKVSIRDKVVNHFNLSFHSTQEIIDSVRQGAFPDQVMFTFHPQRWTDDHGLWLREKYLQGLKNGVKYWLLKFRK
jgi:hypothetical protein